MALQGTTHLEQEVLRARTSLILSNERMLDLLPDTPGKGLADLPSFADVMPQGSTRVYAASSQKPQHPLSPFRPRDLAGASNAWAAAPSRSATGGSLLASDPHLAFSSPSIWYLARLELASGGIIGGTIPGIPLVLMGRSAALGWGLTASYADDQDLVFEQLNPDDPTQYRTPTGFAQFRTRDSIINVKDAPSETLTLRWTENGPVLPPEHYNLGTLMRDGYVAALNWTALSPKDTSMSAGMALMMAKSVQAAADAAQTFIAPSQNLMLADSYGVGMVTIGALPARDARHQTKGRLPSPGWVAQNRWQGTLPPEASPRILMPEGGIIGNTNNKVSDAAFPNHVSFTYGDTQRITRWARLMQSRQVHSPRQFHRSTA
jgi:penicillin amidase